eukprot:353967-Chlamydomonas_euryale.AAC.2
MQCAALGDDCDAPPPPTAPKSKIPRWGKFAMMGKLVDTALRTKCKWLAGRWWWWCGQICGAAMLMD